MVGTSMTGLDIDWSDESGCGAYPKLRDGR
jgi:hypothetical protein